MKNNNTYIRETIDGKTTYLHRRLAGEYRGAPLLDSEEVHHKNEIRTDNSPENLMVMKDRSHHHRIHDGCKAVYDSVLMHWCCEEFNGESKCEVCKVEVSRGSSRCANCYQSTRPRKYSLSDIVNAILSERTMELASASLGCSSANIRGRLNCYSMPSSSSEWKSIKKALGIEAPKQKRGPSPRKKPCGNNASYVRGCRCKLCCAAHVVFNKAQSDKFVYNKEKRRQIYLEKGY